MQATRVGFVFSSVLSLCLCTGVSAQQIESMKLLTPEVGWAATAQKLFWTTNGGAQWKDITPKLKHEEQGISSVFFLDSSTGWVLLRCGDNLFPSRDPLTQKSDRDLRRDDTCFEFASTTDAGQRWSLAHPKITDPSQHPEDGSGFSLGTFLDFADAQHGWAILKNGTHVGLSSGVMLRTVDGGHTWTQLKNNLPMAEHFHFVTAKIGWIAGGPDQELYVTHDAANSWQKVESLPDVGNDLPVFENERRGLLPAGNVLLATEDGGKTWKQDRVLTGVPDYTSLTIADSVVIAAHSKLQREPQNENQYIVITKLSLYTIGPDRNISSNTAKIPVAEEGVLQLSFLDRDQGWVNKSGRLFATRDGGRSWVDISPGGPPPPPRVWIQGTTRTVPRGTH
jgi:photosystem II stability/assembly factor-like uncharacterized protein